MSFHGGSIYRTLENDAIRVVSLRGVLPARQNLPFAVRRTPFCGPRALPRLSGVFQSAPRPRGRGDCGPALRLSHRGLLPHFRQPANPSRPKGFSVVKEQLQVSMSEAVPQRREIPVAGPSLRVRGIVLILPSITINSQYHQLSTPSLSQHQRLTEVQRLSHPVMFDPLDRLFVQEIESQRVFVFFDLAQQAVAQGDPFHLAHLAFKNALLPPHAIILARLRYAPQPPLTSLLHRRNVVCNQD